MPKLPGLQKIFSKETFSVGLNIGVSSVKLVKLKRTKDSAEICGFSLEQSRSDLDELLKSVAKTHGARRINISVSGQQAIIRYVDFPKMSQQELKQALRFEAQKYIPFPVNEVNLDGFIMRDNLPDNKMRILLAAVKKDFLNQRLKLLKDAGLEVDIVDIDSLALINAFYFNYADHEDVKDKTVALLNIGSVTSNLNILENGVPSLSRDITLGGNHLTQKVADALGVEFREAESLKVSASAEKSEKMITAMEGILAKLAQEVRTSFDYYESRSVSSVEKIFISGGGSMYPGLEGVLGGLLGLGVSTWDSLKKITFAPAVDPASVRPLAGQLAVAVGLALRS